MISKSKTLAWKVFRNELFLPQIRFHNANCELQESLKFLYNSPFCNPSSAMQIVDCRKYLNPIQVFLLQFRFHNAERRLWIPLHPLPFYTFAIWIADCGKLIIVYNFYLSAMQIVDCRKQIVLYNFTLPQFSFRNADCRKNLDS